MSCRVLLVDDDARLHELLTSFLEQNGVEVKGAKNGLEGLAALEAGIFDAVLLDVMMPGIDGLEVVKRIRQKSRIPVLMLTAKGDETDRVVGLEIGADDYIAKPFSPRELLARLRAVLRRASPDTVAERLEVGAIAIDIKAREVKVADKRADLTGLEFDILVALARRAGRVVPRDALLEEAGRSDVVVGERTVDVHISHLRQKLGDDPRSPRLIRTVRGVGYVLARDATLARPFARMFRRRDRPSSHLPYPYKARSRLQRTLFLWFGASMVLTAVLVVVAMNVLGGASFRKDADRSRLFVGGRFDEIWDDAAARHRLAAQARRDLDIDLVLLDANRKPIAVYGRPCPDKTSVTSPVVRNGEPIGYVVACSERLGRRPPPWRPLVGVAVAAFMLWAASGLLSFRLSKPFHELAGVAEDLGRGRFQARARLHEQKGEAAVLGTALNDMAARIEKQLADQRALLATVSHELRTPLARIRLLVELARSRPGEEKTLGDIEREVEEVDALVGELLASSRIDFAALEEKRFDLVGLAVEAMEKLDVDAALLEVDGQASLVEGDATLLGRAITNLLNNAQKHADVITMVRIAERGDHLHLEVEDRGPGLPVGEEQRIFEAFYRRPRGPEVSSTGLGLALVQRIAEAHGGTAYASNRADGLGAIVGFSVRAAAPVSG